MDSDVEVHSNQGPVLSFGLTSLQAVCAIELGKGRRPVEVRRQFAVSPGLWRQWMHDPVFIAKVEARIIRREQVVEEALKEGELQASATLIQALSAETPIRQKSGRLKYQPDWNIRTRAAISLLDRRGERGKPVERVQQANFTMGAAEIRNEIAQALADPAVRDFLMQDPVLAARLRQELAQLALPPGEEPCSATPSTDSSDSSPSDASTSPSPG